MAVFCFKSRAIGISAIAILCLTFFAGCTKQAVNQIPLIPLSYYHCIEVNPEELEKSYFNANYGNRGLAETMYNNQPFVFKRIIFNDTMAEFVRSKGYIWIGTIKCLPADAKAVNALKPGTVIDIVGMNRGPENAASYSLVMEDCYLLPTGSLVLPGEGGGTFVIGY